MSCLKLCSALAIVLSALPMAAFAQDESGTTESTTESTTEEESKSPLSLSLAATTDYRFRGLSQTDIGPAFQIGATYTAPFGLYLGGWASNVEFGDADKEVDWFLGYNTDLGEAVNWDIQVYRYGYPGSSSASFNEYITKFTFLKNYYVLEAYSNDAFGSSTDSWYTQLGVTVPLPSDFSVAGAVGMTEFEDGDVGRDYKDWSLSLSHPIGPATASVAYIGTDGKGRDAYGRIADSRFVFTISLAL
ncbi:MAG: TorF family putative porin [Pseudoxanthomonas sp.]